jgi:BlaI family transcriptional regulator, penicillinase repressor
MADAPPRQIQDTEWDLMSVLWERERATARDVADALQERRGWAYSTVKTMLDRMIGKGLVEARRVGNVWEYTPAIPQQQARDGAWRRFVDTVLGGTLTPALELLAGDVRLSKRQRAQLKKLIDQEDE